MRKVRQRRRRFQPMDIATHNLMDEPFIMAQQGTHEFLEELFMVLGRRFWSNPGWNGVRISGWNGRFSGYESRRFTEFFGCSPFVCSVLWEMLIENNQLPICERGSVRPEHLLWSLMFLRQYQTESVAAAICCCDETTYRKWIWPIIQGISELDLIRWENRNVDYIGGLCRVSVDGTDFRVQEPGPEFDTGYYSHKFKGPGLRYEVAISIATSWIVWVNGPFPCGWSDLSIARVAGGIQDQLDRGERYIADSGYRDGGDYAFTPTGINNNDQRRQQLIRARHETINGRFKRWRCLTTIFRHDLTLHEMVFFSVANVTQLEMELEFPNFEL